MKCQKKVLKKKTRKGIFNKKQKNKIIKSEEKKYCTIFMSKKKKIIQYIANQK